MLRLPVQRNSIFAIAKEGLYESIKRYAQPNIELMGLMQSGSAPPPMSAQPTLVGTTLEDIFGDFTTNPSAVSPLGGTNMPQGPPVQVGEVEWSPSPNFTKGRRSAVLDTIILHHTGGSSLDAAVNTYRNPNSRISAHYVIGKDGRIAQCVATNNTAWHAGKTSHVSMTLNSGQVVNNINSRSIGIEIVNVGSVHDPYPPAQINALKSVLLQLKRGYPSIVYIKGHGQVNPGYRNPNEPIGLNLDTIRQWWNSAQ